MKSAFEKVYFFAAVCANLSVFAAVLGGNAAQSPGGDSSALSSGNSDPVLLALNLAFGIATVYLAFPKIPQIVFLLSRMKLLLALYLLVCLSLLWSTDRAATFRNAAYLFVYLVAAAYLALRFDGEEMIGFLGTCMTILALASIPANFILPPDPYQPDSWKGVFLQKNELGIAMTIGITALIMAKRRWTLIRAASLITCSSLLLLSKSMTSILAAAVAIAAVTYLRLNRHISILFLTAVTGAAFALSIAAPNLPDTLFDATGRNATFSGRTAIWGLVAMKIGERPVLGYGYGAFWSTEADSINEFLNGFKPGQAHNGYLEICLDLGILGLVLSCLLAAGGVRRALRLNRESGIRGGDWMLIVTALLLIHNVAESDLMVVHVMWFIFVVTALSCWKEEYEFRLSVADEALVPEAELVSA